MARARAFRVKGGQLTGARCLSHRYHTAGSGFDIGRYRTPANRWRDKPSARLFVRRGVS